MNTPVFEDIRQNAVSNRGANLVSYLRLEMRIGTIYRLETPI
jgi:hypothetical protein